MAKEVGVGVSSCGALLARWEHMKGRAETLPCFFFTVGCETTNIFGRNKVVAVVMSQTGFYVGVIRLNAVERDRTAYDQLEPQVIPVVVSVAVAGKELLWEGAQVTLCAKPSLPPP